MEVYYQKLAQLLPEDERLEIIYDQDLEAIYISTDDVMIHGDTAAKIYEYCYRHSLRCYIAWSYVRRRIFLGISNQLT